VKNKKTVPTTKPRPPRNRKQAIREERIIKRIKNKLTTNQAMVSKADKGNSIVILYQNDYNQMIEEFISNNNFTITETYITKNLQRLVRKTVNDCQELKHKNDRWKYVNLNPMAPSLKGLIKLHKENAPIRPVVNWRYAPGYGLAKMLTRTITSHIPLAYTYNIKDTIQLMNDLMDIP
jgi:hypothetical protein